MTSFDHSEAAQGQIIQMTHRLSDLKDWLQRVPIPEEWLISPVASDGSPVCKAHLHLYFKSYAEAKAWGFLHCDFESDRYGLRHSKPQRNFIYVPMVDFDIYLSFPESTHPNVLNPELANV